MRYNSTLMWHIQFPLKFYVAECVNDFQNILFIFYLSQDAEDETCSFSSWLSDSSTQTILFNVLVEGHAMILVTKLSPYDLPLKSFFAITEKVQFSAGYGSLRISADT